MGVFCLRGLCRSLKRFWVWSTLNSVGENSDDDGSGERRGELVDKKTASQPQGWTTRPTAAATRPPRDCRAKDLLLGCQIWNSILVTHSRVHSKCLEWLISHYIQQLILVNSIIGATLLIFGQSLTRWKKDALVAERCALIGWSIHVNIDSLKNMTLGSSWRHLLAVKITSNWQRTNNAMPRLSHYVGTGGGNGSSRVTKGRNIYYRTHIWVRRSKYFGSRTLGRGLQTIAPSAPYRASVYTLSYRAEKWSSIYATNQASA